TRFFYLSQVDIGGGRSFTTGYDFNGKSRSGVSIGNYPNSLIGWEIAHKTNLGLEIGLANGKADIMVDVFRERRTNIRQDRADIPISMGLWSIPQVNVGEANGEGIDVSLDYNQTFGNRFWMVARGNFTYARSTFQVYEEVDYPDTPWKSRIGRPISQRWG